MIYPIVWLDNYSKLQGNFSVSSQKPCNCDGNNYSVILKKIYEYTFSYCIDDNQRTDCTTNHGQPSHLFKEGSNRSVYGGVV